MFRQRLEVQCACLLHRFTSPLTATRSEKGKAVDRRVEMRGHRSRSVLQVRHVDMKGVNR